ncbi:MAG: metallophosphoesterase [Desulfobacteraceae bacterium]|nr:metallophosphoesterase [Desulfobacteraceae bacterium]
MRYGPVLAALVALILAGCAASGGRFEPSAELRELRAVRCDYPAARFAVFSDPHLYPRSLGTTGPAFQDYLARDRKLLVESEALLDAAVEEIGALDVDFVLVCGDLTKDGERVGHQLAAEKLQRLVDAGKPVFVVPGNHDIANAEALRYQGRHSFPVPTVSGSEFAEIYASFGYAAALERDPDSLSYLAEPVPGLWLLALDSCRWREQGERGDPITDGTIYPATRDWMETVLIRAKRQGKAVIAALHHGIVEHYPHNEKFYGQYLVDDFGYLGDMLSAHGVRMVFTGHFHAQDVTARTFADPRRTLYDIETGSTVTAPCPYRVVTIGPRQQARIRSRFITDIEGHGRDFGALAADNVYRGTIRLADGALAKYKVPAVDWRQLSPQIARAYVTHLAGDEKRPALVLQAADVGWWTRLVMWSQKDLVEGWYTDLPPADNDLCIDLIQ